MLRTSGSGSTNKSSRSSQIFTDILQPLDLKGLVPELKARKFNKTETPTKVLSCEYWDIFKNRLLFRHLDIDRPNHKTFHKYHYHQNAWIKPQNEELNVNSRQLYSTKKWLLFNSGIYNIHFQKNKIVKNIKKF